MPIDFSNETWHNQILKSAYHQIARVVQTTGFAQVRVFSAYSKHFLGLDVIGPVAIVPYMKEGIITQDMLTDKLRTIKE